LSFTGDFVSEFVGGLTPKAVAPTEPKSSVSARQVDLFQAYHNYVSAESSQERLAAGEELQQVLAEQLEVERAYERLLAIVYPSSEDRRETARKGKTTPHDMACEMLAHGAFEEHGRFDANSGFALQFHQYVVNVCADEGVANVDIASAVARACGEGILA